MAARGRAGYWLHAECSDEVEGALLLRVGRRRHREDGVGLTATLTTTRVADDGCQFRDEGLEAVHGRAVVENSGVDLAKGVLGSQGRGDGVAGLLGLDVLVAEEKFAP